MAKRKVCKSCKIFLMENVCPICKENNPANSWQGRITITNPDKSEIAKKIGITKEGDYVIKTS
jgi:DNA-directed RNA polymerase subunit E"